MKQRIITAVIAMALFFPVVIYGGLPLVIVTYILAAIALYELLKMRKLSLVTAPGLLALSLLWIVLIPTTYTGFFTTVGISKMEIALVAVLLYLSYTVLSKNKFTFDDAGFLMLGVLYIGFGFYYLIETRETGLIYLFYCLFIVFATDSGAYFTGRSFGKNKLWPEISPNKTIEGAFGGIGSALVVALLFFFFGELNIHLVQLLLMTIVLSSFGQIGDLVESALKRHYNVKDSGNLLPGHGGILDRFDSLLFVLPLFNIILAIF